MRTGERNLSPPRKHDTMTFAGSHQYFALLFGFFILLCIAALSLFHLFRRSWTRPSFSRSACAQAAAAVLSLGFLCLFLELIFWAFVTPSDGWMFTLAASRWDEKYWGAENSWGYRDREHPLPEFRGKKVLFVVGDSITAGHGIKDPTRRYSDILQSRLGSRWVVVNIARRGWSTVDEFVALSAYPFRRPDVIILGYCLNDFDAAMRRLGIPQPASLTAPNERIPPGRWYMPVVERSYLVNFLFWRVYRAQELRIGDNYIRFLRRSYANPSIGYEHRRELTSFAWLAQKERAELIVAVFPLFGDADQSRPLTAGIAALAKYLGARAVDFSPVFAGFDPRRLVVSAADGHPNEKSHRIIADRLFAEIQKTKAYSKFKSGR